MRDAVITIQFDDDRRVYQPGETLSGHFHVASISTAEPQVIELSVLWYTEGQGDEDLAVHYFQRFAAEAETMADLRRTQSFNTTLPNSPLSYDGILVRIYWCVRVRLFMARGKEVVTEEPFRLGDVPAAPVPLLEEVAP
ncbi:MAG TPA: hypothetical protein VHV77_11640 [Pirellulales bacterium]|jgi:hypothetical protein|nr:hypothetical protein [Pirellulales bacterium]